MNPNQTTQLEEAQTWPTGDECECVDCAIIAVQQGKQPSEAWIALQLAKLTTTTTNSQKS